MRQSPLYEGGSQIYCEDKVSQAIPSGRNIGDFCDCLITLFFNFGTDRGNSILADIITSLIEGINDSQPLQERVPNLVQVPLGQERPWVCTPRFA